MRTSVSTSEKLTAARPPLPMRIVYLVSCAAALFFLTLIASSLGALAQGVADWSGKWDSRWRGGGARLELEQKGNVVTGRYRLFQGRIEAKAIGKQLIGRWSEPGREGEFIFVQSRDGNSFTGRFEAASGEWWTGIRVDPAMAQGVDVDQSSPMATLRSFVKAMNESGADNLERGENGETELTGQAAALIDLSASNRGHINRIDYTRRLFAVIDSLTFRLWNLPHEEIPEDSVTETLEQAGTDVTFDLTFKKMRNRWFIVGPPLQALHAKLEELTAARGKPVDIIADPRNLRTPRDTFKILLWGLNTFGNAVENPAYKTLDTRELSPTVRSHEIPLLAGYIKQVLDRIGYVYWQEIPDDPNSKTPYVHFEHPEGDLVVAPVETNDGIIWQFTPDTLRHIRRLYAAIDEMPAVPALASLQSQDIYFKTRGMVRDSAPGLLSQLGPLERWQWVALALAGLIGALFSGLASAGILFLVRWIGNAHPRASVLRVLTWSIRSIFFGLFLVAALSVLGLPDIVATPLTAIAWMAVVLGAVPVAWHLISKIAESYRRRWIAPGYHETLLSLLAGVARVAVLVAAVLILAEVLAIPYQHVLAGLGIGGLAVALAAQPTLQNFLSGLTLYADRPISVGDFCRFGDQLGTVEDIGMRSTRIRTLDRTVISMPNSEFANMQLENYARRDRIRFVTTLQLRYETTRDQLRYVLAELRKLLIAHPRVAEDPCRVRFVGFGEYSLDLEIFTYILTSDYSEFLAIQEDILLRMMDIVDDAGVQFAFPSQVEYQTPDTPHDAEKRASAEQKVDAWRKEDKLPFPDFDPSAKAKYRNVLAYPPEGSASARQEEEAAAPDRPSPTAGEHRWPRLWWR